MSATVDIESRLAGALRVVLTIAQDGEPDWLPTATLIARRQAFCQAQAVLMDYDEQPAEVVELPARPQLQAVA